MYPYYLYEILVDAPDVVIQAVLVKRVVGYVYTAELWEFLVLVSRTID